ncbi:MAG: hypothetical protein H0X37_10030 [Herpetosiphonaceae bacterium]|nr:hypothetical protein [Herpetosiphonaceae bacterium]
MRFMAHLTFIPEPIIPSLIPAEQARVAELAAAGAIQALFLAANNSAGWLVMVGESQQTVEHALNSLPLHPYMHVTLTELSPYDPLASTKTST